MDPRFLVYVYFCFVVPKIAIRNKYLTQKEQPLQSDHLKADVNDDDDVIEKLMKYGSTSSKKTVLILHCKYFP